MHSIIIAVVIIVAIVVYLNRQNSKSEETASPTDENESENEEDAKQETPDSEAEQPMSRRAEFANALQLLGADVKPADAENPDFVAFEYQNERFVAHTNELSNWIYINDYDWARVDCSDIERFSLYRKTINEINKTVGIVVYYDIVEDANGHQIAIINTRDLVLFNGIDDATEPYLSNILQRYFEAHRVFERCLAKQGVVEDR